MSLVRCSQAHGQKLKPSECESKFQPLAEPSPSSKKHLINLVAELIQRQLPKQTQSKGGCHECSLTDGARPSDTASDAANLDDKV